MRCLVHSYRFQRKHNQETSRQFIVSMAARAKSERHGVTQRLEALRCLRENSSSLLSVLSGGAEADHTDTEDHECLITALKTLCEGCEDVGLMLITDVLGELKGLSAVGGAVALLEDMAAELGDKAREAYFTRSNSISRKDSYGGTDGECDGKCGTRWVVGCDHIGEMNSQRFLFILIVVSSLPTHCRSS